MRRTQAPVRALLLVLGGLAACAGPEQSTDGEAPPWLLARVSEEQVLAARSTTRHDFGFRDRAAESGITFLNRIVDDAGKAYKPVHYDHGTGVAAADVDGDGRPDLFFVSQLGRSELWRNLGAGRFEDITAAAGIELVDAVGVGASFGRLSSATRRV